MDIEDVDDRKRHRPNKSEAHSDLEVHATAQHARHSTLYLPHSTVPLPTFMPVGTQGCVKTLFPFQLCEVGAGIVLGNTYHLSLRPGASLMRSYGGLHKFMSWQRNILTDSGGFQIVSLGSLNTVTEDGVMFRSPNADHAELLTPEGSMEMQAALGTDIVMQLDDVVHVTVSGARVEEAMERSIRWLDRALAHSVDGVHKLIDGKRQRLFAIVQGGLNDALRSRSLEAIIARKDQLGGVAIGGLSGGEAKDSFWRVVAHCTRALPADLPRYCMGVGYPLDLVVCVALGVDMFDCVFPCRTARFGNALTSIGRFNVRSKANRADFRPLDPNCACYVCRTYCRAYMCAIGPKDPITCALLSYHNLFFLIGMMRDLRSALSESPQTFATTVRRIVHGLCEGTPAPRWVREALEYAGITLDAESEK